MGFILGFLVGILTQKMFVKLRPHKVKEKFEGTLSPQNPPAPKSRVVTPAIEDALPMMPEPVEFLRVGANSTCDICGKGYLTHPLDVRFLDNFSHPYLRIRCDGMRIRLQ